ncbi:MAG: methylmalonyl-CoA mutase family protein [Chloroflexi bacterium]|nr:methylmalonyl-CoA mutase family protein [Chloroflexota bacterium]
MPSQNKDEWLKNTYRPAVQRSPEREPAFETTSGAELHPLYTPEDLAALDYNAGIGYPGEYPYVRGVQPTMYRGRYWTMRQYAGFASAEESNRRYRYLLQQGQTGLSVAFDLPTQTGYDSDHPMAEAEVGQVGVPIDSLRDMEVLFGQIPLDKVSTSMTINATAPILLALYLALARRQGVDLNKLEGTIQNDILKEYIARGTYIFPPKPSMRLVTDVFAFCSQQVRSWNTISISGYHMREAGCTAAQELGFTMANAIAYVEAALRVGLDFDEFAGRLSFFFVAQSNFFEEIAKYRAARRLWARLARERFKARSPRSETLRFHTQTAGVSLTAQQPINNIVRTTLQALAGVLGGTQSLHTNSWDEALSLPSEEAVQVALRTQQIIAYESGVADVVDPLGGSYYVESLTNRLEAQARDYIEKTDQLGGALAAIEQGYIQREIQEAAYRFQQEVESQKRTIVGVNRFTTGHEKVERLFRLDTSWIERQKARTQEVRASRHQKAAKAALRHLERAARGDENTMPVFLECVEAYCTIGEICDVLRSHWGEMQERVVI